MKSCPFCAEDIQDAAIKCRYCGSILNEFDGGPALVADRTSDHFTARQAGSALPFTPIPGAVPRSAASYFVVLATVAVFLLFTGLIGQILLALLVLGTSVWVFFDANEHKVDHYKNGDGGAVAAFLSSVLLWVVMFPQYLAQRSRIRAGVEPVREVALHSPDAAQWATPGYSAKTRLIIGLGMVVVFAAVILMTPTPAPTIIRQEPTAPAPVVSPPAPELPVTSPGFKYEWSKPSADSPAAKAERERVERLARQGVTASNYLLLREGMTYGQVVEILGRRGTELSSSNIADISTVMYSWDGDGGGGANMNAMFQNGRMVMKAQFGLK